MVKESSRKSRRLDPPKDQPKSTRRSTRNSLKHDALTDLPLDVLCEIFKFLLPLDLLQLARTTKSFRKFLLNRASKSIWTHVLSAVESLPPCPDNLPAPQYVHLMFGHDCHECHRPMSKLGSGETLFLYLEAWTQLCRSCSLIHFKRWEELPVKVPSALAEYVPATTNRLTDDEKAGPYFKRGDPPHVKTKRTRFHVKTALALHADYKKTKGLGAKKLWKEEQQKIWNAKEEHANACERYFNAVKEKERLHDNQMREKRREQIRGKLRALGWAEELDKTQGQLPPEVYAWGFPPKELTDKEWKKMQEKMIASMEKCKEARLKNEMKGLMIDRINTWVRPAYTTFFFSQPPNTILPTIHEVCLTEPFRTPLCTLPLDQDLSEDLFEDAIAQLPAFAEQWRNSRIEQVLSLVRKSATYKITPASEITAETTLSLASTIFSCSDCSQKVTYPTILVHQCCFTSSWQPKLQDMASGIPTPVVPQKIEIPGVPSITNDVSLILLTRYSVTSWKGLKRIKFDDRAHQHMLGMLDSLGWSPNTTVDEMEEKQPYVECLCRCFDGARGLIENGRRALAAASAAAAATQRSSRKTRIARRAAPAPAAAASSSETVPTKPRIAARWWKAIQPCGNFKPYQSHQDFFAKLEGQDLALTTTVEQGRTPPFWARRLDCFMCMSQGGFTRDALENHMFLEHRVEHPDGVNGLKAYVNASNLWKSYVPYSESYVELEDKSTD